MTFKPTQMRLQPTLESANESESLSEILLLQGLDGVPILVTFTSKSEILR